MGKHRQKRPLRLLAATAVSVAATLGAASCLKPGTLGANLNTALHILVEVGALTLVAAVLEARGLLRRIGVVFAPLVRFSRLPASVAAAMTAALASGSAAALMLADAREEGKLSRRDMIYGALACSPVSIFMFNLTIMFPVLAILKTAGMWYYLASYLSLAAMLLCVLCAARLTAPRRAVPPEYAAAGAEAAPWPQAFRHGLARTGRFLLRVALLTMPVLLWTAAAVQHGVFDFTGKLPAGVRDYLPPAAWTVFAARFGGMLSAAGAAAELLKQQLLSTPQLVLVLLAGNIINGVIRTLRRGIPVSLGIYPGADGMVIATISTALRAGMTLIALGITMVVIHYES